MDHLQHITLAQVDCLETKIFQFLAIIEVVWMPVSWEGVDLVPDVFWWSGNDPVLGPFQDNYRRSQAIRVDVERANRSLPSNYGPLQFTLQWRNVEFRFVLGGKTRLRHLVRCQASELVGNIEISMFCGEG